MDCIKCGSVMRRYIHTTSTDYTSTKYYICDECDTECETDSGNNSVTFKASKDDNDFCSLYKTKLNNLSGEDILGFTNIRNLLNPDNKCLQDIYEELSSDKIIIAYISKDNERKYIDTKPVKDNICIKYTLNINLQDIDRSKDLVIYIINTRTEDIISVKLINHNIFKSEYVTNLCIQWSIDTFEDVYISKL